MPVLQHIATVFNWSNDLENSFHQNNPSLGMSRIIWIASIPFSSHSFTVKQMLESKYYLVGEKVTIFLNYQDK